MSTSWVNTSTLRYLYHKMLIEFSQVAIEVFWNFVAALHIILHQNETTLISLKLCKSNFGVNFLAKEVVSSRRLLEAINCIMQFEALIILKRISGHCFHVDSL